MFVNSDVSYTRNAWIETTQGKKKILRHKGKSYYCTFLSLPLVLDGMKVVYPIFRFLSSI